MTVIPWSERSLVNQTTGSNQKDPDVAVLEDGRFVVVWVDESTSPHRVMQRIYNDDGTAASDEIVVGGLGENKNNPVVTARADGGWVVMWDDTGNDQSVIFDASGVQDESIGFAGGLAGSFPEAVRVDDGHWALDVDSGANNQIDVFRYGGDLSLAGSFTAQASTVGEQRDPSAAQLKNGNVVIAWRDGTEIEFRIFNGSGTAQLINGTTNDQTVTNQNSDADSGAYGAPHVLALNNGGFLMTWSDNNSPFPGNSYDVWGRIYAPDGTPFTDEFLINSEANTADSQPNQFSPVSLALDNGLVLTVFGTNTTVAEVRGAMFDIYGNKVGGEFVIDATDVSIDFDNVDAALMDDGRVVLTWASNDADGSGTGVFVHIIDPRDGNVAGDNSENTLYGSDRDDRIFAYNGDDTVFAGADDDWVFGEDGSDTLHGQDGDDKLFGESNFDILSGGAGDDWLDGGQGIDNYDGGAGNDTISFLSSTAGGVTVYLFQTADQILDDGFGNIESLRSIEWVVGSNQGDVIVGDANANVLQGMEGDDTFYAGVGNDFIVGGRGNDFLQGDDGFDAFAFDGADFQAGVFDTIADFSESATSFDVLYFTGLDNADLTIVDFGGNVFVYTTADLNTGLVINNFTEAQLTDQIVFA